MLITAGSCDDSLVRPRVVLRLQRRQPRRGRCRRHSSDGRCVWIWIKRVYLELTNFHYYDAQWKVFNTNRVMNYTYYPVESMSQCFDSSYRLTEVLKSLSIKTVDENRIIILPRAENVITVNIRSLPVNPSLGRKQKSWLELLTGCTIYSKVSRLHDCCSSSP